MMLKLGADIFVHTENGSTPLFCASKNGSLNVVSAYVQLGSNVNIRNTVTSYSISHIAK